MAWRRKLLALVAVLLGVGLTITAARINEPVAPSVALPDISESADSNVAMAAARRQHEPVMVTSLETATRKVSALPDGTMTAELSAQPMQVRRGDSWVPVDPTLAVAADKTIKPKAVATDTTFSAGGSDKPLVQYGPMAITWPGTLPVPVLNGATATYRDVLPGVDLELIAAADSVSQHLVVKTAEAARNPALAKIKLGSRPTA